MYQPVDARVTLRVHTLVFNAEDISNRYCFETNFTFLIHMFICFIIVFIVYMPLFTLFLFFITINTMFTFINCFILFRMFRIISKNIVSFYIIKIQKVFIVPSMILFYSCTPGAPAASPANISASILVILRVPYH